MIDDERRRSDFAASKRRWTQKTSIRVGRLDGTGIREPGGFMTHGCSAENSRTGGEFKVACGANWMMRLMNGTAIVGRWSAHTRATNT